MALTATDAAIVFIAATATVGVAFRPFKLPEAVWAVAGSIALVAFGFLPASSALAAAAKGNDVYLFLIGMMLLSETARREGLFDWIATRAVNAANGSASRLFAVVYGAGIVVTTFLSNDATAVVLTPAVFAVTKKARLDPLPFLFICAFVANAASFVLPISNPANLVLYGDRIPPLGAWLARLGLPAILSIAGTYGLLRFSQRRSLRFSCERNLPQSALSKAGWAALTGICITALVLLTVSALNIPLGMPTAVLGALTALYVVAVHRRSPWPMLGAVSWQILPLVAGLFVLVAGLARTGLIAELANGLHIGFVTSETATVLYAGAIVAVACNLVNNLPAGLVSRSILELTHASPRLADAFLIGIDLGPNLSVTGSLATILWLAAIRREGESVGAGAFFRVGLIVMPVTLFVALVVRLLN